MQTENDGERHIGSQTEAVRKKHTHTHKHIDIHTYKINGVTENETGAVKLTKGKQAQNKRPR